MNSNTQKNKVVSPPTFESKIGRDRAYFEELILLLKELKPKGWRKEVRHAKKMIKKLNRLEDMNRLEKLRDTCRWLTRRWTKMAN